MFPLTLLSVTLALEVAVSLGILRSPKVQVPTESGRACSRHSVSHTDSPEESLTPLCLPRAGKFHRSHNTSPEDRVL